LDKWREIESAKKSDLISANPENLRNLKGEHGTEGVVS
jgi:hypothetical protein